MRPCRRGCDLLQSASGRGGHDLAVLDALGAHQAFTHGYDLAAIPAQDERFETAAPVETHKQRGDHDPVMLVLYVAQLLRQAGGVVVVDQKHHGDLVGTILLLARLFFLDKLFPDQIADCF